MNNDNTNTEAPEEYKQPVIRTISFRDRMLIDRLREIDVAAFVLKEVEGKEDANKKFVETLVFKIGRMPKSSCKFCYGRGYNGSTEVAWSVQEDNKVTLDIPKTTKPFKRFHYTRIYPCTCIKEFRAINIADLKDGDLYLSINGGDVKQFKGGISANEEKV